MIKRVAVCDACGTEEILEGNLDRAADGWFQLTHVYGRPFTMGDPVTSIRIFCELDCVIEYATQWREREAARPAD